MYQIQQLYYSHLWGLLEEYSTFGREQSEVAGSHIWKVRSLANHRSLNQVRGMCWISCLLTTTPVFCAAQHHVGDIGHPCCTLWWLFDSVVRTRGVQWKFNESTKHYLTQMLLVINWSSWQAGKNSRKRMKAQGRLMQVRFIEIHLVLATKKKTRSDNFLTDLVTRSL